MVVYLAAHYAVFPQLPVASSISDTTVLLSPQYLGKTNLHFFFRFGGAVSLSSITRSNNISNENGEWKSRTNRELEEINKGENIVKWIKGQRIS